jgi:hypothetical protein
VFLQVDRAPKHNDNAGCDENCSVSGRDQPGVSASDRSRAPQVALGDLLATTWMRVSPIGEILRRKLDQRVDAGCRMWRPLRTVSI